MPVLGHGRDRLDNVPSAPCEGARMNAPVGKVTPPTGNTLHRWLPFRNLRARPRLALAGMIFLMVGFVLWQGFHLKPAKALLLGFDVGVLVYLLALALLFKRTATPELMRSQ